jgi:hypothetical protein
MVLVLALLLAGETVWNAILLWRLAEVEQQLRDRDKGERPQRHGEP